MFLTNETVFFVLCLKCSYCVIVVRVLFKCMILKCQSWFVVGLEIVFCFGWYVDCRFCLCFSKIEKIKRCAMEVHH